MSIKIQFRWYQYQNNKGWNAKAFLRITGSTGSPCGSREAQLEFVKYAGPLSFISASAPPTGAVASLNSCPTSRINFPTSRRNASRLLYRISLQLTSPRRSRAPRVHRLPAASAVDREVEAFCIFHLFLAALREAERVPVSFFRNCKGGDPWPGNWNSPLRTRVTRRRWWSRSVEREDGGGARNITRRALCATTSPVKRKQLFPYNCN